MSEFPPSPSIPPLLDPSAIETRLNALTGMSNTNSEPQEIEIPELQEQFLADTSLSYLASRSKIPGDEGNYFEALVEYHRIEFEPNQTRAILHLGFRPDFSLAPSIEATLIDASGRVRVTSSSIFGARIEVTISSPHAEPTTICIETIATNCPYE